MTVQAIPEAITAVLRPSRYNFAQVCIGCDTRWCASAECLAWYEASVWQVCERCDGFTYVGMKPCGCFHGLEEATPESAAEASRRVLPDRPPSTDEDNDPEPVRVLPRRWAN